MLRVNKLHFTFPFSLLTAIIFIPFYILLLNSCTTEPQTGSLTGTVNLEGETDHSGITLGIYELVTLDTTITRINNEYPHIGIKISQHTEFDHRFGNLTKYSQTDAYGNFKIKDIPTGRYNIVALKDSFGFKYIYEIQILKDENLLSNVEFSILNSKLNSKFKTCPVKSVQSKNNKYLTGVQNSKLNNREADIILYPVTDISSNVDTTTTWETNHHYIIEDDITVSGDLTIEPGAIIRLNEGVKLTISGNLNAVGEKENMIWFTSNDSFKEFKTKLDSIQLYNKINLNCSNIINNEFSWCKINWAAKGITNFYNNLNFHHNIISNCRDGFFNQSNGLKYSNIICKNVKNNVNFIQNSVNFNVYNNILINNQFSFIIIESEGTIKNTYFEDNHVGIIPFLNREDNLLIKYNCFKNNDFSISLIGSYVSVEYNNFYNSYRSIQIEAYYGKQTIYIYSNPTINNNNFFNLCTNISIKPEDDDYGWFLSSIGVNKDIVINDNYWKFINSIDQMIIDINDNEDYYYRIIYNPVNYENDAGIQGK